MSKCFIVLGMHRSATSLAAKGLHTSDIFIGQQLLGPDHSNPYGHYEALDFTILNREILSAAGGSWDNPPSEDAILNQVDNFDSKITAIIEKNKRHHWGWKDPRTILTIKLFLPHIENPHFIACFRDPDEVAKSLNKRNQMPIDQGLTLAKEYNRRLLDFLGDFTCTK